MSDVFISYSRKDSDDATRLAEFLNEKGISVGIDLATSWSAEIVEAIENCKAFLVILSPGSISSHNVAKEISLASELKKRILPIDLGEPVELTRDIRYHLAGIQRAPMANSDAI